MLAEFKQTVGRFRGQMIGWGIGLGVYGLLMVSLYDSIQQIEGFDQFMASYPPEIIGFFGDLMAITTPVGYLDIYYFGYIAVIAGIFAVGAGASLLVGDEEKGILDLVLAHPIGRSSLFLGRLLGYIAATVVILLVGWLTWAIPGSSTTMNLSWLDYLLPFIPLFAVLLLFGSLATLFSLLLPSARFAGMLTGGLLVANYLLIGLANINDDLEPIVKYTPLKFYQGGYAVEGLNWEWLAGLLAATLVFVLLAWWRFQRRDIRVGGEGGWSLPLISRRRAVETGS